MPVPLSAFTEVQHEPKWVYDLNIPLAKCKNYITMQRILRTYDTYALKANKGLRLGWRSILRKIWVHGCWKVFSALPQCADRDTKWIFSVDTFTSTKNTHWQNSNKPATRTKVHISRLKVKYNIKNAISVPDNPLQKWKITKWNVLIFPDFTLAKIMHVVWF